MFEEGEFSTVRYVLSFTKWWLVIGVKMMPAGSETREMA